MWVAPAGAAISGKQPHLARVHARPNRGPQAAGVGGGRRSADLSRIAGLGRRDHLDRARRLERRRVGQVERLGPEFQVVPFANTDLFDDAQVHARGAA